MKSLNWLDEAFCVGADVDLFYPSGKGVLAVQEARFTIRVFCDHCTVSDDCLDHVLRIEGMDNSSRRYGIYGGTTAGQRAKLAAERRSA